MDRLEKFIFTEWKYDAEHTLELQKALSKNDQQMFNLDISELVWLEYFQDLNIGARVYLNKEPMKNLAGAKVKDNVYVGLFFFIFF